MPKKTGTLRQTNLNSVTCMTWRIRICDMTYLYVWRESIITFSLNCIGFTVVLFRRQTKLNFVICMTWLIRMCDMTYSYVWHDSFTCVTWHIHMCYTTPLCEWHGSFICMIWLNHQFLHEEIVRGFKVVLFRFIYIYRYMYIDMYIKLYTYIYVYINIHIYMYVYIHIYKISRLDHRTKFSVQDQRYEVWYRGRGLALENGCCDACDKVANTHRIPYLYGSFPAKITYI